ncbi:hypothetical protein ACMHYB_02115 [Sorangium sp. So ce1128]
MTKKQDDLIRQPDADAALPSEGEPVAVELHRETTETVLQRRVREVVRFQPAPKSIPIDKLRDPVLAQALLDERDFWREQTAERDESNLALQQSLSGLREQHHQLDKRCALAEEGLKEANRTIWLEVVFFTIGGALFGAGISPQVSWPFLTIGLLLIVAAMLSGLSRWRRHAQKGDQ